MWVNKKNNTGFTIIETLIVLAVTGLMFVSTVALVSGQISRYQFQSSMRQLQVLIQREINDVQSGYFPEVANTNCIGASVVTKGQDLNCVIVGKRISLVTSNPDFPGDTAHPTKIRVDTLGAKLLTLPIVQTVGNNSTQRYRDYENQIKFITTTYIDLPGDITYHYAACPVAITGPPGGPCPSLPTQWGDAIEINILYSSATRGASNYYNGSSVVSSGESVALYTNFLEKLSLYNAGQFNHEGKLACFTNGSKYGSISFGNTNSDSVDLNIEDSRCNF